MQLKIGKGISKYDPRDWRNNVNNGHAGFMRSKQSFSAKETFRRNSR